MRFGYSRVSTAGQARDGYSLDAQRERLESAGCEKVFTDVMSGAKQHRPALDEMRAQLREGDVVVAVKLDRLGRSLSDLTAILNDFQSRGVVFESLNDGINTATTTGRMIFGVLGSIAEMEREMIYERTQVGIAAARAAGKRFGRPPKFDARKIARARELSENESLTAAERARVLGVSRATYYRLLNAGAGVDES